MKSNEFIQKIESGEAKVLTVEAAKNLKGKKILWMYFGYSGNENEVQEMKVGDIVSELEYYSNQPCEGYESRADYWKSYMSEKQLETVYKTLMLLDSEGKDKFIKAHLNMNLFDEPTFTCSDADREVYYMVVE